MKTTGRYEEEFSNVKKYHTCKKCKESFIFKSDESWWIEQGTYSEKVTKCPHCGCINVVKYQDGFNQNPNFDRRYFK